MRTTIFVGSLTSIALFLFAQPVLADAAETYEKVSERIEFSGFSRVVLGYLDTDGASYEGYTDRVSPTQASLFALQSDITITDTLSFSAQLLAHTNDERESGIEWMYLTYEPTQNWRFKAGKLRTPFFRYSDVIDVGFAYPWISPPQQIYSGFLFSNYQGATGTYMFSVQDTNIEAEAYYGKYEGEFERVGQSIPIDVDEIKGVIFSLNRGNLNARVSVTQSSDFFADVPEFTQFSDALEFAGFLENAESLRFNGKATGYQASINYDTLDYFLAAEWVKIKSDLLVIPIIESYYVTAGYNFHPFQIHVTYSASDSYYNTPENLIPKGIDPQLTALSFAYDQVTNNLPLYNLNSVTLGLRWDFRHNMSAKAEVTLLDGKSGENSFFNDITDPNFDRQATLYQIALEWVF